MLRKKQTPGQGEISVTIRNFRAVEPFSHKGWMAVLPGALTGASFCLSRTCLRRLPAKENRWGLPGLPPLMPGCEKVVGILRESCGTGFRKIGRQRTAGACQIFLRLCLAVKRR